MPWLLMSPGHQQPRYWVKRIIRTLWSTGKDFKCCIISVWRNCRIWAYWLFSTRLQYLHCISNGDTAVLHWAIHIYYLSVSSSKAHLTRGNQKKTLIDSCVNIVNWYASRTISEVTALSFHGQPITSEQHHIRHTYALCGVVLRSWTTRWWYYKFKVGYIFNEWVTLQVWQYIFMN